MYLPRLTVIFHCKRSRKENGKKEENRRVRKSSEAMTLKIGRWGGGGRLTIATLSSNVRKEKPNGRKKKEKRKIPPMSPLQSITGGKDKLSFDKFQPLRHRQSSGGLEKWRRRSRRGVTTFVRGPLPEDRAGGKGEGTT